jgi:lyso-ornithine lipid O-acyltransferase
MTLRRVRRALALALALALGDLRYWFGRLRGPMTPERRARWMQQTARAVLAGFGLRSSLEGQIPAGGLVVSNHLSYLDIVVFAAAMPCCFVSKTEVRRWPVFGGIARAGATIFLDRASRASANAAAAQMADRFRFPVPVLLFPEGTSTDGSAVLRFHARLFQPAVQARAPITVAAIRYETAVGREERDLCWYADAPFLPHLWRVLGMGSFTARVRFGEPRIYASPRAAVEETHALVAGMRAEASLLAPASRA